VNQKPKFPRRPIRLAAPAQQVRILAPRRRGAGTEDRKRGLATERYTLELHENDYGRYRALALRLATQDGVPIANLIPVGASIIGAKGRVDLEGTIDQAILVDWDKGGPAMRSTIAGGADGSSMAHPIYRGVDEAGWYWVESRKLSRAHKLDEHLFFELLFLVSEHDLRG